MSNISEKNWKTGLISILEELEKPGYAKMLELLGKIPKSKKTGRSREKMAQIIIEHYGVGESISAINDVMDQIPRRDPTMQDLLRPFVDKLRKEHEKEKKGKKRKRDPEEAEKRTPAGKKRKRDPEEEEKRPPADRQKSCRPEQLKIGQRIYPESPVCSIVKAKKSADRTKNLSVEGTVTEVNPAQVVQVKDERKKTQKQSFKLQDETDSIEIFMWSAMTKLCKGLSVGDVIKITNMKTNKYYKTVSLNSTASTRIHKVQSVGIQKVTIEIKRIIKATKKTTHLEADLNLQVHAFEVTSQRLAKAFGIKLDGDFRESLLEKIPLSAEAEIEGGKIKKITVA